MAIDLKKENYDENGNRKPLTVYPDKDSPEIYPAREIYPQPKLPVKAEAAAVPAAAGISEALPAKSKGRRKKKGIAFFLALTLICITLASFLSAFIQNLVISSADDSITSADDSGTEKFSQNDVQEIHVLAVGADIVFEYDFDGGNAIKVSGFPDRDEAYYSISNQKGSLILGFDGDPTAEPQEKPVITFKFPRRFDGKIDIGGKNCNITADAGGTFTCNIESGNIAVSGMRASTAELATDAGYIDVYNSDFSDLSIYTAAGAVNLMDSEISDSLKVTADMGSIDVRRIISSGTTVIHSYSGSHYGADVDSSIYGENLLLEGNAEFVSETGGMRLYNTDFRDLLLVSLGRVDVWTSGDESDYSIRCIADVNSTNLTESSGGEYTLNVTAPEAYFEFGCDPPDV